MVQGRSEPGRAERLQRVRVAIVERGKGLGGRGSGPLDADAATGADRRDPIRVGVAGLKVLEQPGQVAVHGVDPSGSAFGAGVVTIPAVPALHRPADIVQGIGGLWVSESGVARPAVILEEIAGPGFR
jgi:hypothetical protein